MDYKILGEGAYGIVVSPALNIHKSKKNNNVSKVVKKTEDYKKSLKISKIFKKMKSGKKHFCLTKEILKLNHSNIPNNLVYKSNKLQSRNNKYASILMPNCGQNLMDYNSLEYLKKDNKFLKVIKHLLKSLKLLKKERIVLIDIQDNILLRNHKPLIIDYDKCQILKKKNTYEVLSKLEGKQGYFSPELLLFANAIYDERGNIKSTINQRDLLNILYINSNSWIKNNQFYNKDVANNITANSYRLNELYDYFKLYLNPGFAKKAIRDMNHDLLFKSDVYALGRVLEELNYHLQIKDNKILTLIDYMTAINHNVRFSIEECLKFIKNKD